jgi:polysaccharide pyruvyl transferase WcaK-like protein
MLEFDFVVTSKYHGIVFSHVLGEPVILSSYRRKMDFDVLYAFAGNPEGPASHLGRRERQVQSSF